MKLWKACLFAIAVVSLSGGAVYADTLNFNVFPFGHQDTTTLVLPNATLTTPNGVDFFIGAAGVDHEVCAYDGNCEADINIVFNEPIHSLTLETFGYETGDFVDFYAYDVSNNLLGSVLNISANTVVSGLSGLTGVKRLFIDDHSTWGGYGYDNFQFQTTSVPEPSTMLLLGSGLLGLWGLRRKFRN